MYTHTYSAVETEGQFWIKKKDQSLICHAYTMRIHIFKQLVKNKSLPTLGIIKHPYPTCKLIQCIENMNQPKIEYSGLYQLLYTEIQGPQGSANGSVEKLKEKNSVKEKNTNSDSS